MLAIEANGIGVTFHNGRQSTTVLQNMHFQIHMGEIIAIRGSNGTGKTTLLNLIAGVLVPSEGRLTVTPAEAGKRGVGFVQQDYTSSLLPWFDVAENIAIPLRLVGIPRKERHERVLTLITDLGFSTLPLHAYPHQLSGGQRQRIAIARALIGKPAVLLLDEPFANLDGPSVRVLQHALLSIHRQRSITMVIVSHDLDSSLYLADRVLLLHGRPANIHADVSVTLSRPRIRDQLVSSEFATLRAAVLCKEELLDGLS